MGVPPGNRRVLVPRRTERYVAGADTRGRQEGWPYLWSQQVIHEMSGLKKKYERKFAGKSIRRWQEKRRRHSHLKTLSNAPAGTSTSLGDQATSMFTAGTVTATIPSLSVSALAP